MKILALSDCHYKFHKNNQQDEDNAANICNFLRSCIGKYELIALVGDIFDLWWDGRFTIVKQYFPLLKILADLHEAGARIIYISGNHDFWFGDFLSQYLGCEIYPDGVSINADGKNIRFEHGDIRTVNDLRYHLYRRVIRLEAVKALFSLLHPDLALGLGTMLSRSSRARKEKEALRKAKSLGLKRYAANLIKQGKADIVVMGHSHNPELELCGSGFYANCGDWLEHYSYIEIDAGNPALKQYGV